MELEVIQDDHDPDDLMYSFSCPQCEEGYVVGWDDLCGDKIYYDNEALQRLKEAIE